MMFDFNTAFSHKVAALCKSDRELQICDCTIYSAPPYKHRGKPELAAPVLLDGLMSGLASRLYPVVQNAVS